MWCSPSTGMIFLILPSVYYVFLYCVVNIFNQCILQMAEEIGSFLEHTNALSEWLDRIEDDIDKIDSISIYPDELIEQSSLLTKVRGLNVFIFTGNLEIQKV